MIKQYRKYGAIPFLRSLIVYSFVLYLLCAYFTVILPLPSIASVEKLTTPWVQLKPFTFVNDIISAAGIKLNDFSTYLNALKIAVIYEKSSPSYEENKETINKNYANAYSKYDDVKTSFESLLNSF